MSSPAKPPAASQAELKRLVGEAALAYVEPGSIVGVGTGSTVNCFIDALATLPGGVAGAVSSSEASTARLRAIGVRGAGSERGRDARRSTSTAPTRSTARAA